MSSFPKGYLQYLPVANRCLPENKAVQEGETHTKLMKALYVRGYLKKPKYTKPPVQTTLCLT